MKYYTPEIDEFHVGFEFEYSTMTPCGSSTEYVKDIFKDTDNVNTLFKDLPNDWYDLPRVKYLDREDIESLGWIFDKTSNKSQWKFHKNNIMLYYRFESKEIGFLQQTPLKVIFLWNIQEIIK